MKHAIGQHIRFLKAKLIRREVLPEFALGKATKRLSSIFVVLTVLFGASISGCADIKPWVKPYERDNLADPIMSLSRHGYSDAYMHHVYQAREGARGAEGGTGGGCGCN